MTHTRDSDASDFWVRRMSRGEFAAAWQLSDRVLRERGGVVRADLPRHLQNVWDGTSLAGRRVLIRCYHGLGDTIQFVRYAPLVKRVAARVMLWAQPDLVPLLRTARGVDEVLPLTDGAPATDYDCDVEIMELPHVFRTTLATVPSAVPYLHVRPAAPRETGARDQEQFLRVGLVWRAGDWDERRSVPLAKLAPLTRTPGVAWHVLQRGPGLAERPAEFGTIPEFRDIIAQARFMRSLDLVISIDSMPAHLAGALGVPVWTLLRKDADWRWMISRPDSPWYPTMRLFRQDRCGEWESVVARAANELRQLVADRRTKRRAAGSFGGRRAAAARVSSSVQTDP